MVPLNGMSTFEFSLVSLEGDEEVTRIWTGGLVDLSLELRSGRSTFSFTAVSCTIETRVSPSEEEIERAKNEILNELVSTPSTIPSKPLNTSLASSILIRVKNALEKLLGQLERRLSDDLQSY